MTDRTQKQLNKISQLPASREALHWLRRAKEPLDPTLPAVIQLLMWALERSEHLGLDLSEANLVAQDLLYLTVMGNPLAAVLILLNLDDPENEALPIGQAQTLDEVAGKMVSLAIEAKER